MVQRSLEKEALELYMRVSQVEGPFRGYKAI